MIKGFKLRNSKLIEAVNHSNKIFKVAMFYVDIRKRQFDKATCSGEHIAGKIMEFRDSPREFTVKEYRSRFPSKVNAYVLNNDPNTLYINTRNLGRNMASVVATVVHEAIHSVDHFDTKHSFGHGDNKAKGKENCAPNWIGNHAKRFVGYKVPFVGQDSFLGAAIDLNMPDFDIDDSGYNEVPHVAHFGKVRELLHKAILS